MHPGRRHAALVDPVEPIEQRQRFVRVGSSADRILEESPRLHRLAAVERGQAAIQQLLGLALPLGHGAPGTFDVRARPGMAAVEKQRAGPDVDRLFELGREVVVKAGEQQLLDLGVPIPVRRGIDLARTIGRKRL